eukprot:scaffold34600_cov184-Amphora_coffeaeformis.AAC.2
MNIMYVRRKTNTGAAENNGEPPQAQPSSLMRRFRKTPSKTSSFSEKDSPLKQPPSSSSLKGTESLADLHSELQVLASEEAATGDSNGVTASPQPPQAANHGGNGIRRLLKGKKLVRVVKRVPGRNLSSDTLESHGACSSDDGNGRKVLRVKVKRKKKEDNACGGGGGGINNNATNSNMSVGDADSMAPAGALRRGGRRRRTNNNGRSDASVGTGIVSRAKSWFTFGGMKVGSNGRDFLGVEDDDEDEDDDEEDDLLLDGGRTEYGDDYTNADVRTTATPPPEQPNIESKPTHATNAAGGNEYSSPSRQQPKLVSSLRTPTAATTAVSTTTTPTPPATFKPQPTTTTAPTSPGTSKSPAQRPSSSIKRKSSLQSRAPVQEIIPQPSAPRKPPLTGVALRRLQIQEEWLSKGCNYQPNEFLRSTLLAAQQQKEANNGGADDNASDDVSEISYDEPMVLVMGPDAPVDGEVAFWTHTTAAVEATYGPQHGRAAECLLNRGVAALNARQTSTAIEYFLEAVNVCQDKYGESSLAAARALHLLGSAFFLEGQLPMAAEATLKSLEIRKMALGPFHTDTVDTFSNLAMVYLKQGKLLESARIFTEVLQIRTAIYNAWHPSVAFPARSLAAVYAKRKDKDRARQSYLRALQCFERHGMLAEHMDTEAEMRRFGIPPPVEEDGRTEI